MKAQCAPMSADMMARQRASALSGKRVLTVLTSQPPEPFGFGSSSPARPIEKFPENPGPGAYNPSDKFRRVVSKRGQSNGFASKARRRLEFTRGTKNPSPNLYLPVVQDYHIAASIGEIPMGKRVICYPDEKESSTLPGPGSYGSSETKKLPPSPAFCSKSVRQIWKTEKHHKPSFDGRNYFLSPSMLI